MKRLALAFLLVLATFALAQDEKKPKKDPVLPWNPVENAKEGDWTVFSCHITAGDKIEKRVQTWRVTKVGDKVVSIEQAAGADGGSETIELPAKEPPTIAKFCDVGSEKVMDLETTDEKRTVGNREFTCKKLSFRTYDGQRILRATLWLSKDVKGSGVVGIHLEGDLAEPAGGKAIVDFEVAGFGTKDKTEFGKTRAELAREIGADKPAEQPKKDEKGDKGDKK
ncbi:MAG: hypothetical protein ACAI25_05275 [Planctomycetota bacterium]